MISNVRTLALALAGAMLLASCGVINSLIPDQTFDDGILGIGQAGVQVDLTAPASSGIQSAAATTTFSGVLAGSATVDGSDSIPDFVDAEAIEEAISMGTTLDVNFPTVFSEAFTVTALTVQGTVAIDGGTPIALPAGTGVSGLSLLYTATTDLGGNTWRFTTTSSVPTIDVDMPPALVAAFGDLLRDGGTIDADLIVTMTLAGPGIEDDATITLTLTSLGATVSF